MSKPVTHESKVSANAFGGQAFGTLCGRMSDRAADPINVGEEVTCKLCLRKREITQRAFQAIVEREKAQGERERERAARRMGHR